MNRDFLLDLVEKNNDFIEKKIHTVPGLLFSPKNVSKIDEKTFKIYENTIVDVIEETTVEAILSLKNNGKIGVLNFASGKNPGGGYLNGRLAQEESLCYCSNLYFTIKDSMMYQINKKANTPLYTDYMIASNVKFFRDNAYKYMKEYISAFVVSSPAVNVRDMRQKKLSTQEVKIIMKNRMRNILKLMAHYECENIVLGSFGCGVFENNPTDISNNWRELLYDEGFIKYFKRIIFAIYDSKNSHNFPIFKENILRVAAL